MGKHGQNFTTKRKLVKMDENVPLWMKPMKIDKFGWKLINADKNIKYYVELIFFKELQKMAKWSYMGHMAKNVSQSQG